MHHAFRASSALWGSHSIRSHVQKLFRHGRQCHHSQHSFCWLPSSDSYLDSDSAISSNPFCRKNWSSICRRNWSSNFLARDIRLWFCISSWDRIDQISSFVRSKSNMNSCEERFALRAFDGDDLSTGCSQGNVQRRVLEATIKRLFEWTILFRAREENQTPTHTNYELNNYAGGFIGSHSKKIPCSPFFGVEVSTIMTL